MIRNWYSMAGVGVLIVGTILFFHFSSTPIAERISLSAHETDIKKDRIVTINDKKISVEIASNFEQKSNGLSYRETLDKGTGMLFVFDVSQPVSFWMFKMNFSLDIIWINNGKIIGIERNVPYPTKGIEPEDLPTYPSPGDIDLVLEINAGEADEFSLGDKVEIININST